MRPFSPTGVKGKAGRLNFEMTQLNRDPEHGELKKKTRRWQSGIKCTIKWEKMVTKKKSDRISDHVYIEFPLNIISQMSPIRISFESCIILFVECWGKTFILYVVEIVVVLNFILHQILVNFCFPSEAVLQAYFVTSRILEEILNFGHSSIFFSNNLVIATITCLSFFRFM